MINELESRASRRDDIKQRLGSIDVRLGELRAAWQDDPNPATSRERAALAQRHLAASQAAADQAMAASAKAFRRAAAAHERAALRHERAAAVGSGDKDEHERRAALHRAAQARDAQRADRVESLIPDERMHEQDSKDVDTGSVRQLPLAGSNIALRLSRQPVRCPGLTASPPLRRFDLVPGKLCVCAGGGRE